LCGAVSRCVKCGVDYGRDRLASLAILCRGRPFAVSAEASWKALRDEYMYPHGVPDAGGSVLDRCCQRSEFICVYESTRLKKRVYIIHHLATESSNTT
jgi:hypothetical protein